MFTFGINLSSFFAASLSLVMIELIHLSEDGAK